MLYGCVTWNPRACHYVTLRRAHHSFVIRCFSQREDDCTDLPIPYVDTLMKTGSESINAIMRGRRMILFAGLLARMDTRLPNCVMFGKVMGRAGCREGAGTIMGGVSPG